MATLAELGLLEAGPGPARPRLVRHGGLFHGMFRLLAGDLNGAVSDLSASVGLARREAGGFQSRAVRPLLPGAGSVSGPCPCTTWLITA